MFYSEAAISTCSCKHRHNMAKLYIFQSDVCHMTFGSGGTWFTSAGWLKNKSGIEIQS